MKESMQPDQVSSALAAAKEREAEPYFQQAGELLRAGHMAGALAQVEKAVACSPRTPRYVGAQGSILFQLHRHEECEKVLRQVQKLAPGDMEITGNLELVLRHRGYHDEALSAFRMVVSEGRATPKIFEQLGLELVYQGILTNAEQALNKLLKSDPDNVVALTALGRIKSVRGDDAGADTLWQRALALQPGIAAIFAYRAQKQVMGGDTAAAVQTIKQALDMDPACASALFLWTHVTDVHVADGEDTAGLTPEKVDAMITEALADPAVSNDDWLDLKFAAGKLKSTLKDHDAAFHHYDEANRNVWARQSIPRSLYDNSVRAILEGFDSDFFDTNRHLIERKPAGNDRLGAGLIFVFGMPRSGTTLVEQIIARDSTVVAGGEWSDMEELFESLMGEGPQYPHIASDLSIETVRRIAGEHHDRIKKVTGRKTCFTDKMLRNFMYLGLLRVLFPLAKFVNCVRHPVDTCLSCYFNYFTYGSIKYSYNLEMLGRFHNHYKHLMERWHQVLPGVVLDVRYEDLVNDPDTIIRDLVAWCDLPWGDHFLSSSSSGHMVSTASAAQVRKPIHQGAIGRWQAYDKHLAPLMEILKMTDSAQVSNR